MYTVKSSFRVSTIDTELEIRSEENHKSQEI